MFPIETHNAKQGEVNGLGAEREKSVFLLDAITALYPISGPLHAQAKLSVCLSLFHQHSISTCLLHHVDPIQGVVIGNFSIDVRLTNDLKVDCAINIKIIFLNSI